MIHISHFSSWGREERGRLGFLCRTSVCTNSQRTVLPPFHLCGSRSSGGERLIQGHTVAERRVGPRTRLIAPSFKPLKSQPEAGARLAPSSRAPPLLRPGPRPDSWPYIPDLLRLSHLSPHSSRSFRTIALVASQPGPPRSAHLSPRRSGGPAPSPRPLPVSTQPALTALAQTPPRLGGLATSSSGAGGAGAWRRV